MVELAIREGQGFVPLAELAKAQGVSPKYLEQLTIPLRNAGLVRTQRGPSGGYELAKEAREIAVLDIISAICGPLVLLDCLERPDSCKRAQACAARRLWHTLNESIVVVLAGSTLAQLRDDQLTSGTGTPACHSI